LPKSFRQVVIVPDADIGNAGGELAQRSKRALPTLFQVWLSSGGQVLIDPLTYQIGY
jgi:hypothetical protein